MYFVYIFESNYRSRTIFFDNFYSFATMGGISKKYFGFWLFLTFMLIQPILSFAQDFEIGYEFSGNASYYHMKFQGIKTASGENYDSDIFTCANVKLPFGTMVEITNLNNGRKVIARVNDRGPYSGKRVLDMSHAAAKELNMLQSGIIKIKARVVGFNGEVNISDIPTTSEQVADMLCPDSSTEKSVLRTGILKNYN